MEDKVCTSCGYVGKPIKQSSESFLVDVLAWLITINVALMTGLLPLLLIPLAWTVYHVVNFNTKKCPKCTDLAMVRSRSHSGRAILSHAAGKPEPWSDDGATGVRS